MVSNGVGFDVTPIGLSSTQEVFLSSVGDGAATISNVSFSNGIFAIVESSSNFSIPEDGMGVLTVSFNPIGAGTFRGNDL